MSEHCDNIYFRCNLQFSVHSLLGSAALTIVPVVPWEAPAARGGPPFWHLNVEKTFANHKFRVGLHITCGLNDRRIGIQ